jgi:hypothetical protein
MLVDRAVNALRKVHSSISTKVHGYVLRQFFERFERCGRIPLGALVLAAHKLRIQIRWVENTPDVKLGVNRKWLREYLAGHQGGKLSLPVTELPDAPMRQTPQE